MRLSSPVDYLARPTRPIKERGTGSVKGAGIVLVREWPAVAGEWEVRKMGVARSLLAVPASNRKMVEKALASGADAVFLDLEDAVAPERKAGARDDVVRALGELDWGGRPTLFRVNALDTRWFYRDVVEVVEAAGERLDAVLVPKVDRPEDLHAVAVLLAGIELEKELPPGKIALEAQIETARGLTSIEAIARSTGRLGALHFGPG
ncbi:MAG: aldolase/citrate lyase family protein, partial [Actinomycetota bacterium]|nr:aldolase/citrate lyase family protein [Actinomycetota bacterium]